MIQLNRTESDSVDSVRLNPTESSLSQGAETGLERTHWPELSAAAHILSGGKHMLRCPSDPMQRLEKMVKLGVGREPRFDAPGFAQETGRERT